MKGLPTWFEIHFSQILSFDIQHSECLASDSKWRDSPMIKRRNIDRETMRNSDDARVDRNYSPYLFSSCVRASPNLFIPASRFTAFYARRSARSSADYITLSRVIYAPAKSQDRNLSSEASTIIPCRLSLRMFSEGDFWIIGL